MSDLTAVLLAAQSGGDEAAVAQLKALETQNFANYIGILSQELSNDEKPDKSRQLAGILLKNSLNARSTGEQQILTARWNQQAENLKQAIRSLLLNCLGNKLKAVTQTAALAIGKLSFIDYPQNKWPDLVERVVAGVHQAENLNLKAASFEALGYICEELPRHLENQSNVILNAIAKGMSKEETNNDVKLAATKALANSLNFARANFESESERNLIIQMILSATQSENLHVRTAAFQCLVQVADSYYDKLSRPYMQAIFTLTKTAIEKDSDEVAQQAIEFWSTICDQEISIHLEHEQADEQSWSEEEKRTLNSSSEFIMGALPNLLQLLFLSLTKQSDDPDSDAWTAASAAGACLRLCAETVEDEIVAPVLQFVEANITSANWRLKEAAILSFGCILDGPSDRKLEQPVTQAFPTILNYMKDNNALVKDTAAWTVGRVCELHPGCVVNVFDQLINSLVLALQSTPKVAATACWALLNLSQSVESNNGTSRLSRYFEGLMMALFATADRQDSNESALVGHAYEAINGLIVSAASDVFPVVHKVLPELMRRLALTIEKQAAMSGDREKITEIQSLLCGSLQVIIRHRDYNDSALRQVVDSLMALFLKILETRHSTVNEQALYAIGAIADRVGKQFEKYVAALKPFLMRGLESVEEVQVCTVSIDLVGELCAALEEKFFTPLSDDCMKRLLEHLQNPIIEKSVKPHILACLGDIAQAVGGLYDRYLPYSMKFLSGAAEYVINGNEEDLDYVADLKRAILDGLTGIFQGLMTDNKQSKFVSWAGEGINGLEPVMHFLDKIAADENAQRDHIRSEDEERQAEAIIRISCGLIGDLASKLPRELILPMMMGRPSIQTLIQFGLRKDNDEPDTTRNAEWAAKVLQSISKK